MDLSKTGRFIAEQRKLKNLTQIQLAEKINVSEKTISKWECGKGFPDTSLILPLCEVLNISANELLSAKILDTNTEYKKQAEQNLVSLKSQNEKITKYLLSLEYVVVWFGLVILLGCCVVAAYVDLPAIWKTVLILFGMVNILISIFFGIIIETKAGFYECKQCNHKYIPTYKQVFWATHFGRTRYLKCPKCGKRSWSKKTINNE